MNNRIINSLLYGLIIICIIVLIIFQIIAVRSVETLQSEDTKFVVVAEDTSDTSIVKPQTISNNNQYNDQYYRDLDFLAGEIEQQASTSSIDDMFNTGYSIIDKVKQNSSYQIVYDDRHSYNIQSSDPLTSGSDTSYEIAADILNGYPILTSVCRVAE